MMGTGLAAASDNIVTGKATVMSLGKRILLVRGWFGVKDVETSSSTGGREEGFV